MKFSEDKGFSLIESVMAIAVLAVMTVPLLRLTRINTVSMARNTSATRTLVYAENVMDKIMADYRAYKSGRGYQWVITNWSGVSVPSPPAGLGGTVTISSEYTYNTTKYVVVTVTVTETGKPNMVLTAWLVNGI